MAASEVEASTTSNRTTDDGDLEESLSSDVDDDSSSGSGSNYENDCSVRSELLDGRSMTPLTDLPTSPLVSKSDDKVPIILTNDRGRRKSSLHVKGLRLAYSQSSKQRSRDYGILVLSALYCKLLVVLGISLPMSEIISPMIPTSFYVGFYLYLYFGCILFLLYAYLFLLRPTIEKCPKSLPTTTSTFGRILPWSRNVTKPVSPLVTSVEPDRNVVHRMPAEGSQLSCGSFYLRAGAIAFGIGSMIYSGLEFVQFFEFNRRSFCYKLVYAITPLTQMTFTFVQLYFIFLNSKMRAYKYKNVARFGLMHMVGTNLCIWLFTVIMESKFEILRLADPSILQDDSVTSANATIDDYEMNVNMTLSPMAEVGRYTRCRRRRVLGKLVQNISPLLFPCSIQYSLICAAICFIMWKNISRSSSMVTTTGNCSPVSCAVLRRHHQHYRVDCTGSIKGLFSGIVVLVTVIISVILYLVLINKPGYRTVAIREAHLVETTIYLLTTPVLLVAMWRIRKFRYHVKKKDVEVDNVLLVFAQTGIYLFSIFSMIGGHLSPDGLSLMVFGASAARIVQATVQTVFILDASHRTCRTSVQAQTRPGRELITFLLVCNFAMWLICTLWIGRSDSHPVQLQFYGFWGWTIISRFCSPLSIFFRFHSTVCLCEVWKKLYKYKLASDRTYSP